MSADDVDDRPLDYVDESDNVQLRSKDGKTFVVSKKAVIAQSKVIKSAVEAGTQHNMSLHCPCLL